MLFELPKFSKDYCIIGPENFFKLRKIYRQIIGINNIHHCAVLIEDPNGYLTMLSYNPSVLLQEIKQKVLPYDGSFSPTVYRNREIYKWEEFYQPQYFQQIKKIKEYNFGITKGVVLRKKFGNFNVLYALATTGDGEEFWQNIINNKAEFLEIGDFCYNQVRNIYNLYERNCDAPYMR